MASKTSESCKLYENEIKIIESDFKKSYNIDKNNCRIKTNLLLNNDYLKYNNIENYLKQFIKEKNHLMNELTYYKTNFTNDIQIIMKNDVFNQINNLSDFDSKINLIQDIKKKVDNIKTNENKNLDLLIKEIKNEINNEYLKEIIFLKNELNKIKNDNNEKNNLLKLRIIELEEYHKINKKENKNKLIVVDINKIN